MIRTTPNPTLTDYDREHFDALLERVLETLPDHLHRLLDEVPLIVEDRPAPALIREFCSRNPDLNARRLPFQLCGLYTGFPITIRHIEQPMRMPDRIQLFRMGIVLASRRHIGDEDAIRRAPELDPRDAALLEQIRITLLHEIGHHFGLDEDDLEELGYG